MRELVTQEIVSLPGPEGRLAGRLAYGEEAPAFACLLVNPHPLMGGGISNNIIDCLGNGLAAAGGVTLCFDYSGVGDSEGPPVDVTRSMQTFWTTGHAPEDASRLEEARAALGWLRNQVDGPCLLVGYSFGAATAASLLDETIAGIVMISPTILHHGFAALEKQHTPKLVIHSDDDFATPSGEMARWLARVASPLRACPVAGAGHFFRGMESILLKECLAFAATCIESIEVSPCLS